MASARGQGLKGSLIRVVRPPLLPWLWPRKPYAELAIFACHHDLPKGPAPSCIWSISRAVHAFGKAGKGGGEGAMSCCGAGRQAGSLSILGRGSLPRNATRPSPQHRLPKAHPHSTLFHTQPCPLPKCPGAKGRRAESGRLVCDTGKVPRQALAVCRGRGEGRVSRERRNEGLCAEGTGGARGGVCIWGYCYGERKQERVGWSGAAVGVRASDLHHP